MVRGREVLLCLAGVLAVSCGNHKDKGSSPEAIQEIVKETQKNCFGRSSRECVYFDFLTLLEQVLSASSHQRVLSHGNMSSSDIHVRASTPEGHRSGTAVQMANHLLTYRMFRKLNGWSGSPGGFGNNTLQKLLDVVDLPTKVNNQQVSRGRRFYWWKYLGSLLLTLALTVFSALISKALTLATISLLLSLLGLLGGLGGTGGGHGGYNTPPLPAYRSPTTIIAAGRHPAGLQYEEEPEDPTNPYVYMNRKNWKSARSSDQGGFYKFHYEQ